MNRDTNECSISHFQFSSPFSSVPIEAITPFYTYSLSRCTVNNKCFTVCIQTHTYTINFLILILICHKHAVPHPHSLKSEARHDGTSGGQGSHSSLSSRPAWTKQVPCQLGYIGRYCLKKKKRCLKIIPGINTPIFHFMAI